MRVLGKARWAHLSTRHHNTSVLSDKSWVRWRVLRPELASIPDWMGIELNFRNWTRNWNLKKKEIGTLLELTKTAWNW